MFSKYSFFNKSTTRVSNRFDPDQGRRFVGPDLGPNCLQRLSADDTTVVDEVLNCFIIYVHGGHAYDFVFL